ncbi:hypothetical protein HF394_16220 [Planococcus glaciei]|uniref:Uncharacterized protein n=1 Tax=Planococcus glaciei TaxID=459472 RepID=A0A7H8QDA9_9BACL|nr:hypothetical protein [Planococcus glaciei]ETP67975.1 hypothetical protein G159_14265 [Planococcus glaciei CHR43]QKX51998.1 hypothetical protein HF394_16220 [Planococcus glaciei]
MKDYLAGAIISLLLFFVLMYVDQTVYRNVMPLNVIIMLLVLHVIFFKYLLMEKRILPYILLLILLVPAIYFSLPALTYHEAEQKILNSYDLEEMESILVPLENDSWNPFTATSAHLFTGKSGSEEITLLVNTMTGEILPSTLPY